MSVNASTVRSTLAGWRQVPIQEVVLPFVIIALVVAGTIVRPGVFLTQSNLLNVLTQVSITGVIAIGMTFVIATGGIDLSVGSLLAAAGIAGGLLADNGTWIFLLGAVGFGLLLGAVNGLAVTWGRVVPFVATLAMLTVARGLALWMSEKTPIPLVELTILAQIGNGTVLGMPIPALVFLVVTAIGWVVLNRTTFGRHVVAIGGNRSAARIAGIRSARVVFSVYALTGLCAGLAAVLLSGRLGSASPVAGNLTELDAIAAVVIGGTSLAGGRATVTGTFFGVVTFGLIFNLLNLLNMPSEIQGIVKGALILAAVALQRRTN
jgi:ribose/xylose/arabinose/galactoside ABC-type transport system permease subunit